MNNWTVIDGKLYKKFEFDTFPSAINFMILAMPKIEQLQHHPEWKNLYNTLEVWLCTHDEGNIITQKDHDLAFEIDKIFNSI